MDVGFKLQFWLDVSQQKFYTNTNRETILTWDINYFLVHVQEGGLCFFTPFTQGVDLRRQKNEKERLIITTNLRVGSTDPRRRPIKFTVRGACISVFSHYAPVCCLRWRPSRRWRFLPREASSAVQLLTDAFRLPCASARLRRSVLEWVCLSPFVSLCVRGCACAYEAVCVRLPPPARWHH